MAASRIIIVVACLFPGPFLHVAAHADVFNLPAGLTSLETVAVNDPGNVGELSGKGAGYPNYGPDRICGSVGYAYNIGKYEVTAGQYTEFLNRVAATDTHGLYSVDMMNISWGCRIQRSGSPGNYSYSVPAEYANRPVNYVSFWNACRFANWLHNGQPTGAQVPGTTETGAYTLDGYNGWDGRSIQRNTDWEWAVTSEDEWYKAAYYKGGSTDAGYWKYPTSSDTAPGQDLADVSGNNANCYVDPFASPIDSGKYTTEVGQFQNSAGPYGTFDQAGNVWEWNEAIVYQDATDARRGNRGGAFYNRDYFLLASYRTDYPYPTMRDRGVGFRVVQVPEPGSLVLLVVGTLGLIGRKRRIGRLRG